MEQTEAPWQIISELEIVDQALFPVEISYTAGLNRLDHPELLITGLDSLLAQKLLKVAIKAIQAGEFFIPGSRYRGLLRNYELEIRPVSNSHHRVLEQSEKLHSLFGVERWSACQLVWPDADGYYPWDWGWGGGDQQPLFATP